VTGISRLASIFRLALLLTLTGLGSLYPAAEAREHARDNALTSVTLSDLPPEARQTLQLIQRGGPFPYPQKDGSSFANFARQLPAQTRGYYREYTVPTPGSRDRGARRIIAGEGPHGNVAVSGEYYYTDDHYRSFRRIREP
jgi:ribonuclease T1